MFAIAFTPSALDDLASLRKRGQTTLFNQVEEQLAYEPTIESRNRKRLRPNHVAEWELRIDTYRIFYDVDADMKSVEIKLVGQKKGNKLIVRGKEFTL